MSRSDRPAAPGARNQARLAVRIGRRTVVRARVELGSAGLLAVGALVSGTLLSTAVLVASAARSGRLRGTAAWPRLLSHSDASTTLPPRNC